MRVLGLAVAGLALGGCAVGLPEGKPWTVDTQAWQVDGRCSEDCVVDAYLTRDFAAEAVAPARLESGATITVHCFVPTPATHADPAGREAYRWYLVSVEDEVLWAPDLALTGQSDLRLDADAPGDHLAAGIDLCHSGVPGR